MVVVHGDDFLQSLQYLFDEAGERGRDPQAQFDLFKEPLIQYILARQCVTAAKARASLNLFFTDRRRPETVVQLPPTTLKLDEGGAKTLRGASSGNEFIGLLRVLIDERVRVERMTTGQLRSMKAKMSQTKGRAKGKGDLDSEQKVWNSMMAHGLEDMKEHDLPTFIPKRKPLQFFNKRQKMEVDAPMPSIETHEEVDVYAPRQEFASLSQTVLSTVEKFVPDGGASLQTVDTEMHIGFSEDAPEDQKKLAETKERLGSPELGGYDSVPCHFKEEDVDMAEDAQAPIADNNRITAMASSLDPEQDGKRSADSQMISEDDNQSYPSLSDEEMEITDETTPETQSEETPADSLLLLRSAISRLSQELAPIPPAKWDSYQTKLFQLCDNHNLFTLPFKERLNKMVRIIYLHEEEEAISTEDWSRMAGVVKICAFLAQTTGPALEPADERMVNGWVIGRLRDIRFLVCKERIFGLTAESEVA